MERREFGLWSDAGGVRYFLMPTDCQLPSGDFMVLTNTGQQQTVDEAALAVFEIKDDQARAWAKVELGHTLDELKTNIEAGLAKFRAQLEAKDQEPIDPSSPITPNAAAAVLDFFTALPRVVGQGISGDEARVAAARETMAALQQRLKESGVDVDDRLQQFPERLAALRKAPEEPEKKPE